jgi:hypothetical protein
VNNTPDAPRDTPLMLIFPNARPVNRMANKTKVGFYRMVFI